MPTSITLGEKLKKLRAEAGLTQPQLATQSGINQSYLSKIENDNVVPSDDILFKICEVFNIKPEQLLLELDSEFIKRHYHHIPSLLEKINRYKTFLIRFHRAWIICAISFMVFGLFGFTIGQSGLFFPEEAYTYSGSFPEDILKEQYNYQGKKAYIYYDYYLTYDKLLDEHIQREVYPGKPMTYNLVFVDNVTRRSNQLLKFSGSLLFFIGFLGLAGEKLLRSNGLQQQQSNKKSLKNLFDGKMATIFLLLIISASLPLMSFFGVPFANQFTYQLYSKYNLSTDTDLIFDSTDGTQFSTVNNEGPTGSNTALTSEKQLAFDSFIGTRFSTFTEKNDQIIYAEYRFTKENSSMNIVNKILLLFFPLGLSVTLSLAFFVMRERRKHKLQVENNSD